MRAAAPAAAPPPLPPAPAAPPEPPAPGPDDDLADILRRLTDDEDATASSPGVGAALTRPTDVTRPERPVAAIIESDGGIDFRPEFASYGARLVGLAIDTVVASVLLVPGVAMIASGSTLVVLAGFVVALAGFVVATAWYATAVARTGQWIGGRVTKTRVVDARNGRYVPVATAATRYVVRSVVSPILLFGFLMAFTNSDRRTFHDTVAGTIVTRRPRERWSLDDPA